MKKIALLAVISLFLSFQTYGVGIKEHADIKGPYSSPQEVTRECISCHEDQANDFSHSQHWHWAGNEVERNGKKVKIGKFNIMNNFCVNINSNEPRCTSCHTGYGWKDSSFDFSKKENMDCLVCHDSTGTYKKFPTDAGYPVYKEKEKLFKAKKKMFPQVDLLKVARNVKNPQNKNCASCHFNGGGGHGVKHGDLDNSLLELDPNIDVHMGNPDPEKRLSCADCHKVEGKHSIRGASHASRATGSNRLQCIDCHEGEVHNKKMKNMLNRHSLSLDCKTCHIPVVAAKHPTKTWWDWTSAGDKKRKSNKDESGKSDYSWKKGNFIWSKNLMPEYYWDNGKSGVSLQGDVIEDPGKILNINPLDGSHADSTSKIAPFKVMRGKQFYDPETKHLLIPKLFGKEGYWKTLDWNKSFELGMKSVNLPYSGKSGVVTTEMYWTLNHMVAPAKKALSCKDCHPKDGTPSRMRWKELGYPGDPVKTNVSRLSEEIVTW